MQKAVIFDIDGTLADNSERQAILENDNKAWTLFFSQMGEDKIYQRVVELYKIIQNTKKYAMLIVTGRPDKYRKLTEQWLIWNGIEFDKLYMRPNTDDSQDHIIKEAILSEIQKKYDIAFVFDDRSSVVKMWREHGLQCFQCQTHDY